MAAEISVAGRRVAVGTVQPLVWGLREVLDYHEVLLNRDDIDAKSDAFIDFLADRVVEKEFRDEWGTTHRVRTFGDLERLFRSIFDGLESAGRSDVWRTHHIATIRKVRNRLMNISIRLWLVGGEVDWMMKISSPRTFSSTFTKVSPSGKGFTVHLPRGMPTSTAMAVARGLFDVPVKIFTEFRCLSASNNGQSPV